MYSNLIFNYQVIINISTTLQHESSMKFIYRGYSNILKCVVLVQSFYFVLKEERELFSSASLCLEICPSLCFIFEIQIYT